VTAIQTLNSAAKSQTPNTAALFSVQVPSLLLFEYNKTAWADTSLRAVALDLASSGYVRLLL
jgi:hypothetical protein